MKYNDGIGKIKYGEIQFFFSVYVKYDYVL